jgi:tyrosine-protein phosphatase SIW14
MVAAGIYRCGHPNKKNFSFIKELNIKTILYLCPEKYRADNQEFCRKEGISVEHMSILRRNSSSRGVGVGVGVGVGAGRSETGTLGAYSEGDPFAYIDAQMVAEALAVLVDRRRHPVLVHCHKGDHGAGCIVGCFRRLQQWSLSSTLAEYRQFAMGSPRSLPQRFVDLFDPRDPRGVGMGIRGGQRQGGRAQAPRAEE